MYLLPANDSGIVDTQLRQRAQGVFRHDLQVRKRP